MRAKKKIKGLIAMLLCFMMVFGCSLVSNAAGESGIQNNGMSGIYIDINSYPYTYYAQIPVWGQYAYTDQGCAWFATSRACQITGKQFSTIYSGSNWYNNAYANYGFSRGSQIRENALACYENHIAVVEKIEGNQAVISEGGFLNSSSYGYTTIRRRNISDMGSAGTGGALLGYVYLTNTPVEVSLSWSNSDCQYDTTNAYMYIEADTNVSGSFTEAGITVWNEAGGVVGTKSENPGVTGTHLNVWYNLTNELGIVLQPGTNYKYQFHTVFNGKRYESSVMSFRTNGQTANSWTKELSIDNWVYGETAKTPSATAKYGTVVYTYSSEKNGTYTAEVPKNAGTYYVKATVAAVENQYTGLEAVKEFKIEKATPQYTIPTELTMTYGERLGSIELPEGFEWYDVTELSGPVGERSAEIRYVPEDENNYNSVENIPVTVTVNAKDLSGIKLSGIDKNTDLDKYQIKDGDTVLVKDTDYTISSVTKNDTVTVTVEFIGNYTGSVQTEYSIKDTTVDNGNSNKDSNNSSSDDKKVDKKDKTKESDDDNAPKTGDSNSVAIWVISIMLAGGAIITILNKKRTFR